MAKKQKRRSVKDQMKKRTEEHNREKDYGGSGAQILDLSNLEDAAFFKPEEGKHLIDIIPYEIKTGNHPKYDKGDLDYLLEYYVHYNVGPGKDRFVCMAKTFGKPCPICEELEILKANKADEKTIDALQPKRRVLYNVIDLNEEEKGIQLFETSHFLFEKEKRYL